MDGSVNGVPSGVVLFFLSVSWLGPECRPVPDANGLLSFLDCHGTVEAALAAADHARGDGMSARRTRLEAGNGQKLEIGERRNGGRHPLPGRPPEQHHRTSPAAARVLSRETGIKTRTLQWFLLRHENLSDPAFLARAREQFKGKVLAVDESSIIGTVQMESLLRIAHTLQVGRVVLVGDTRQLRAVDTGQPFRVLQLGTL